MAFDISSIQHGKRELPPRILLLGTEKIGKSTFAAGSTNPVFIPIAGEEGVDALDVAKFPTVNTFNELMDALGALATADHDYGTVVIDSTSALEPLIWQHVCQANGWKSIEAPGYGKGYVEALNAWRQVGDCIDFLRGQRGMASILIGHVVVRTFTDPVTESYDTYEFDINKKAAAQLMRWADCILFANRKTIVRTKDAGFGQKEKTTIGGDEHKLFTQKRPAHPGGGRGVYGRLPYELPLDWESFVAAVAAVQ